MADDLIQRLTKWRNMHIGEPLPDTTTNNWGVEISTVCGDAIIEIERLRALAGPVQTSPSLHEVKDRLNVGYQEASQAFLNTIRNTNG